MKCCRRLKGAPGHAFVLLMPNGAVAKYPERLCSRFIVLPELRFIGQSALIEGRTPLLDHRLPFLSGISGSLTNKGSAIFKLYCRLETAYVGIEPHRLFGDGNTNRTVEDYLICERE